MMTLRTLIVAALIVAAAAVEVWKPRRVDPTIRGSRCAATIRWSAATATA
jgi:hypothetical protein